MNEAEYKEWLNIYTNAFTKSLTNAIALTHLRQWEKIEDTFNNITKIHVPSIPAIRIKLENSNLMNNSDLIHKLVIDIFNIMNYYKDSKIDGISEINDIFTNQTVHYKFTISNKKYNMLIVNKICDAIKEMISQYPDVIEWPDINFNMDDSVDFWEYVAVQTIFMVYNDHHDWASLDIEQSGDHLWIPSNTVCKFESSVFNNIPIFISKYETRDNNFWNNIVEKATNIIIFNTTDKLNIVYTGTTGKFFI